MTVEAGIWIAVALWFAQGWYLNTRLTKVYAKVDKVFEAFDGLREYLYEIDPQFDDERESERAFYEDAHMFAGMDDMELHQRKEEEGYRTLHSSFLSGGFRSPRDRKESEE